MTDTDIPRSDFDVTQAVPAAGRPQLQIEWSALCEKYAHLRALDTRRSGRVAASVAERGQTTPVLVVETRPGRYVLIDGYCRVRALRKLGRDTALAVVVDIDEADALSYCYRLASTGRRSALEDGWLVRELIDGHCMTPLRVADALGRSTSWVSRHLGLVRTLPEEAQEAVRAGRISPNAAMKGLLPLCRASAEACRKVVLGLEARTLSARQGEALLAAWKAADAVGRERLEAAPSVFLTAHEAQASARAPRRTDDAGRIERELELAEASVRRVTRTVDLALVADKLVVREPQVIAAFSKLTKAATALGRHFEEAR